LDRSPGALPPFDPFRRRPSGRPLVSGHRGALREAPENTMASFARAHALGADLVEFDVQRTADGQLVVLHDATLDRTTSGRGPLSEVTFEQVRRLDAGAWFGPAFAGALVPALDEVLDWMRGRVYPILELKQRPGDGLPSLVEPVAAALEAAGMVDQTLVLSFDHGALIEMKARLPGIRTAITYGGRLADTVGAARAARADVVWPSRAFLIREDLDGLHAAGLAVGCEGYTVAQAMKLVEWGVDMVEMDDLAALVRELA
jgi:glycerophosphoryl diester phosphodiesterase